MREGKRMHTRRAPRYYGAVVVMLASLVPAFAADIKVASPVFDRGVFFKENGNVRPLGRIFEHVPLDEMPRHLKAYEGGAFEMRNASGAVVSALVDNHIFLTGSVQQHQNTFPGKVRVDRGSGA